MKKNYIFLWAMSISIIHVLFLWNWWSHGLQAIGINLTVFWLCMLGFYIYVQKDNLNKKSALWIVPIALIAISFSFYATEFTSGISLFILPSIFFLFTTHQSHVHLRQGLWSRYFGIAFIVGILHYVVSIFQPTRKIPINSEKDNIEKSSDKKHVVTQVIMGVLFLFILASMIIVPLLSSADAEFAKFFENFLKIISNLFKYVSPILLWKTFIVIIGIFVMLGLSRYWRKKLSPLSVTLKKANKADNSIMIGIVLGGILAMYLLFIGIQIKTLFVGSLPIEFTDAEDLVKSGFWQLIMLTVLNVILYAGIYNKNTKTVQKILSAFTVASLLLVVSAGQRVYLYVHNYGLSFEKFFALYTVIFCVVVFVWFISLLLRNNKEANIVKTLMFTALWMYSVTTIIPLERIIFSTNLKLTQQEGSRVNINELTMLGFDALESVEKNKDILLKEAVKDAKWSFKNLGIIKKENVDTEETKKEYTSNKWNSWLDIVIAEQHLYVYHMYNRDNYTKNEKTRKWYEKTFKEIFYKSSHKVAKKIKYNSYDNALSRFYVTFRSSNHGFEFDNPKNLYMYFNDFKSREELKNGDFRLIVYSDGVHDEELKINFYNKHSKSPSKRTGEVSKLVKKFKAKKYSKVNLKNFPNKPAYMLIKKHKKKYKRFELIIEFPNGYMVVKTNNNMPKGKKIESDMLGDDYMDLMTTNKDFKDIIKSIRPINSKLVPK